MNIYCSGIGGIGLSAYASHMRSLGHSLSGSDRQESPLLNDLRAQGIDSTLVQDGQFIPTTCELFVYSEAIPENAPERVEARRRGIRCLSYFEAVGELTRSHALICIAGTHGKSSTTSMAATTFMQCGKDPNVIVGTKVPQMDHRNWRRGSSDLWIVEACEYRRSFLHLSPTIVVLTNADGDHFDAFASVEEYQDAFKEFVQKIPADGALIIHGSDPVARRIASSCTATVIDADVLPPPILSIPGEHMRQNAQLVCTLAEHLGIERSTALAALKEYKGSWRRMENRGMTSSGVTIIDDYGHHPIEIQATLAAIRQSYPTRKIVCVFQPHMHDRTMKLWKDFTTSFHDADEIVLVSVYDARPDCEEGSVDMNSLAKDIEKTSDKPCIFGGTIAETHKVLTEKMLKRNDIAIVMGAGDIGSLADALLKQ